MIYTQGQQPQQMLVVREGGLLRFQSLGTLPVNFGIILSVGIKHPLYIIHILIDTVAVIAEQPTICLRTGCLDCCWCLVHRRGIDTLGLLLNRLPYRGWETVF